MKENIVCVHYNNLDNNDSKYRSSVLKSMLVKSMIVFLKKEEIQLNSAS